MRQTTKRLLGIAAASVLVIGATTGVFAGAGFGPAWGGPHGMMGGPGGMHGPFGGPGGMMTGDPVTSAGQQLARLKTRLDITHEQEPAWNAYADAVKGKAGLMLAHRQAMFGTSGVTADQRLSFQRQGMAQMQTLAAASRDLYAVLAPQQQARAGGLMGPRCARR